MTVFDRQPLTPNFLSPLNFRFIVKKCPAIDFHTQKIDIPGISLSSASSFNPFNMIPYAGDHISFDMMNISFKVDEKLQNYLEIFNWIRALGFPETWDEYAELKNELFGEGTGLKSDISVLILDSSKNPIYEVLVIDAFPIMLSKFVLDSTSPEVAFITCDAVFQYTNFRIIPSTPS